jgi:non-specific serine/threonine protein kinase
MRQLLLILDNCEHLLDACAKLAESLLRSCPQVRILATSRESLGIAGEVSWHVPSLAVPEVVPLPPAAELLAIESVGMFVERARAARPDFLLTGENAFAVAQICQRLDGIPLALELAAARLKGLSAEQLAARLDQRFRLLTVGSRVALPRQQTLAAMVGWSYDLLNEQERALFNRLAVFVGGFTLEAAEDVCPDAGDGGQTSPLQRDDVLDLLLRLVDKSLVVAEPSDDGEARYRLLETLRQYSMEKLAASGETDRVRARHAGHYLAIVERATIEFHGPKLAFWHTRLRHELNNLRAALRWTVDAGDVERALHLCGALSWLLYHVGQPNESRRWLKELLTTPAAAAPTLGRARALLAAARLDWGQLELVAADALLDEALVILRPRGDQVGSAEALGLKALVAVERGDYAAARGWAEESVTAEQAAGLPTYWYSRETLLQLSYYLADYPRARAYLESLITLVTTRDVPFASTYLDWLGHVATASGDFVTARARLVEGMRLRLSIDRKIGVAYTLNAFAGLAAAQGQLMRAVHLSGAASKLCEISGMPSNRAVEGTMRDRLPFIRAALGDTAYDAAWIEGHAMTLQQAVTDALSENAGA